MSILAERLICMELGFKRGPTREFASECAASSTALVSPVMDPEIERNIQAAIGHNNQQLLADMARMLDEKMGGLKRSAAANHQLEEIKKLK